MFLKIGPNKSYVFQVCVPWQHLQGFVILILGMSKVK